MADNEKVKQALTFDDTPINGTGSRQRSCLQPNKPSWKSAFSHKAIALLDRTFVKFLLVLLVVVVLHFGYTTLFGQLEWTVVDDITSDSQSDQHNKSDTGNTKWDVHFWNFGCSAFYGMAVFLFTWMITYMDSVKPGINPPTPVSPRQFREQSGHTFHTGYVMAFINGFAIFVLSWWYAI